MYETRLIMNQYSSLCRENEDSERKKKEIKKQFIGYELTYLFFHIIARFFTPLAKDSADLLSIKGLAAALTSNQHTIQGPAQ